MVSNKGRNGCVRIILILSFLVNCTISLATPPDEYLRINPDQTMQESLNKAKVLLNSSFMKTIQGNEMVLKSSRTRTYKSAIYFYSNVRKGL